jgi:hypothetical protein
MKGDRQQFGRIKLSRSKCVKIPSLIFAIALIAMRALCREGLPTLASSDWAVLTNTANFHELYSITNLPPKVLTYILSLPLGVQTADRERMKEPKEPFTRGFRLVWAATDGRNYIVHYEFLSSPDSRTYSLGYCITAAFYRSKDEPLKCCNGGYRRRLKDYKDFIDYELHPLR